MFLLNLPKYNVKVKKENDTVYIFDIIRKKYLVLTPEEWVRQNFIHYLVQEKKYPKSHFAIERGIKVFNTNKRVDIAIFNRNKKVEVLVECKSPKVTITQSSFDQIARYNISLGAKYIIVTNGINHYYAIIDLEAEKYIFIEDIPTYNIGR